MTFDEALKVVDDLLTREAKAAMRGRRGTGSVRAMALTPIERRAIERVVDRALDRTGDYYGDGSGQDPRDVAALGGDPSL